MKIFECRGLEISNLGSKQYIKVSLSYDNIINCYVDRLEKDNKHLKINFKEYFDILNNIIQNGFESLIIQYTIFTKSRFIICEVNNKDISTENILDCFIWDDRSLNRLKEIFNCNDKNFDYLCRKVIEFEENTPIVLKLLGEYIIYLLELDRKDI